MKIKHISQILIDMHTRHMVSLSGIKFQEALLELNLDDRVDTFLRVLEYKEINWG